ncbi:hypothetical protein EON80_00750 [bacterium]|nr:MAG: hypothetical protein EON80_00750 [bacterium]
MAIFLDVAFWMKLFFVLLGVRAFWIMVPLFSLREDLFIKLRKYHPDILVTITGQDEGEPITPQFGVDRVEFWPLVDFINGTEEGLNEEVKISKRLVANQIKKFYKNIEFSAYAMIAAATCGFLMSLWLKQL